MKKSLLSAITLILVLFVYSCEEKSNPVDTYDGDSVFNFEEAKSAYRYLNEFRADPTGYGNSMFDSTLSIDFSDVEPLHALKWNNTLQKVAESKARDMSDQDYFDHVNPDGDGINILMHEAGYLLPDYRITDRASNSFESIAAATYPNISGKMFIDLLIEDKGVESLGHRLHLLGMTEFHKKHVDIGIGFSINPEAHYKNYMCIIIAHQEALTSEIYLEVDMNNNKLLIAK